MVGLRFALLIYIGNAPAGSPSLPLVLRAVITFPFLPLPSPYLPSSAPARWQRLVGFGWLIWLVVAPLDRACRYATSGSYTHFTQPRQLPSAQRCSTTQFGCSCLYYLAVYALPQRASAPTFTTPYCPSVAPAIAPCRYLQPTPFSTCMPSLPCRILFVPPHTVPVGLFTYWLVPPTFDSPPARAWRLTPHQRCGFGWITTFAWFLKRLAGRLRFFPDT